MAFVRVLFVHEVQLVAPTPVLIKFNMKGQMDFSAGLDTGSWRPTPGAGWRPRRATRLRPQRLFAGVRAFVRSIDVLLQASQPC